MSEQSPRRQPPSPLIFSPESILPPIPIRQNASTAPSTSSRSDTVSMPFVKRHVTRRLKTAKAECDKELQRVTNSITAFFEEKLRESEADQLQEDRENRGRDREFPHRQDSDSLREPFTGFLPADLRSALGSDDASSDGGYEAEIEFPRHSRQRASLEETTLDPPRLMHWSSSPGLLTASNSSSPSSLRRQHTLPRDKPANGSSPNLLAQASASSSPAMETTSPKKLPPPGASTTWKESQGAAISRRLSRSIHIGVRPVRSGQSSRSTSRSRSPLPRPLSHEEKKNRRSSRVLIDDPVDPIMSTLYDIIAVATDITEMSISQITSQPKICEQLVQRVQHIGKAWDEHPDWHGRNWYVQVLLAVASLSRVIEWWEAEKQFWNFDEKKEDDQDEPLIFVMKPAHGNEVETGDPQSEVTTMNDPYKLSPEEDKKLKMVRPPSLGRRSRDEATKDISMTNLQLGHTSEDPDASSRSAAKFMDTTESARVLATERLRLQAETAQNHNIVMELSLDGDHILWINYAWQNVIGTNPEELQGGRMSRMLAPEDWTQFRDATQQLQDDDSHTVEVRFKLQVETDDDREGMHGVVYRTMEGKGMLMVDREQGQPSHTMWVIKPVTTSQHGAYAPPILLDQGEVGDEPPVEEKALGPTLEPITPFCPQRPINTTLILCRICECSIPQWYFEKHNETCSEIHRLEAEIGECNESVSELRNTIRELIAHLDQTTSNSAPEYRGMPIFSPSTSPASSSPLQMLRIPPLKMQRIGVKKMQRQLLERLDDILLVAWEVSMPALKEDESKEPIERQRLLSPGSERKMSQVRNWSKPQIEDSALAQLADDAERIMRQKVDNVIRMQNVIKYSEKIRQEWEDRVEEVLSQMDDDEEFDDAEGDEEEEGSLTGEDEAGGYTANENSSSTSEFAFGRTSSGGSGPSSSDPTPIGSSPAPSLTRSDHRHGWSMHTRPSTPSSVSSPLALAIPITASRAEEMPPLMDLNDPAPLLMSRSPQNLEPKLHINPLLSPIMVPQDAPPATGKRGHSRRMSTIAPIISPTNSSQPLSPRLPSIAPSSRTTPTSIKDFEIIKPISKGAFGSVFLARKKATGDYFAIKVLKKADMIAKNQITNVKAERMILMQQAESPFVTKLYWTFQSKENLYLVMEYLNGGDCAALIKSLGSLPEEWTKNYIAEVVLGLEYLHQRNVVHRDLKPDNLLIDQHGHLKLTDFGLSRIGLLGRQTREGDLMPIRSRTRYSPNSRPPSIDAAYLTHTPYTTDLGGSYFNLRPPSAPHAATSPHLASTDDVSESSGSESFSGFIGRRPGPNTHKLNESPLQSFASELTNELRSHSNSNASNANTMGTPSFASTPPGDQKFVGTPDYLAPETILGLRGDDAVVDWWALGVITYEFLYGIPPFHDDTPEKVFENILSGNIQWHEDWVEYSPEARDFMQRLMTYDPAQRLGANGADEVKSHPFLAGIDWGNVTNAEAAFIPQVTDPESTDYFDPRGAVLQLFNEEDSTSLLNQNIIEGRTLSFDAPAPALASATIPVPFAMKEPSISSPADDDFGTFSFKNLPVLKQANDDVIRKLKTDQMAPMTQTLSDPAILVHSRKRSLSQRMKKPPSAVVTTATETSSNKSTTTTNPPSPATSTSSIASSPSRGPSTPGSTSSHVRKPSEFGAVERFKLNHFDGDLSRRNSMPSRLRASSVSTSGEDSVNGSWPASVGQGSSVHEANTPPSSVASIDLKRGPDPNDRAVTCLLAEDNPITAKIIETLLSRLGCRCVVVADGSEAISVAMGDIKFDCILMDLHMPIVDGEGAARYIKSTNNKNASTPIIAVSAYSGTDMNDASNLFAASLAKPLQKADLVQAMRQLGFKTSPAHERIAPKILAR